jgi:hypothetical protein
MPHEILGLAASPAGTHETAWHAHTGLFPVMLLIYVNMTAYLACPFLLAGILPHVDAICPFVIPADFQAEDFMAVCACMSAKDASFLPA